MRVLTNCLRASANKRTNSDMECAQIRITGGTGTAKPSPLVKIPGIYSKSDPGLTFNFWGGQGAYVMPGPAVATL